MTMTWEDIEKTSATRLGENIDKTQEKVIDNIRDSSIDNSRDSTMALSSHS